MIFIKECHKIFCLLVGQTYNSNYPTPKDIGCALHLCFVEKTTLAKGATYSSVLDATRSNSFSGYLSMFSFNKLQSSC